MYSNILIFSGIITLQSPLIIGSGDNEKTDNDVIKDKQGVPFIPATSFAGILRHQLLRFSKNYDKYFGDKEFEQSRFRFSDLLCVNLSEIKVRDGIRINKSRGIVEEGGKFDFEVVERETSFSFKIEFPYHPDEREEVIKLFRLIKTLIDTGYLRIGAKTNNGFGVLKITEYQCSDYNLKDRKELSYFLQDKHLKNVTIEPIPLTINISELKMVGRIIDSFIIRDYSEYADSESLKSLDKPVITGSSIKGAIRSRAEKIVNTLNKSPEIIKNIFGDVSENEKTAQKGKIRFKEVLISKYTEEVQNRIKINRFTSATINTALFDSMPLFFDDNSEFIELTIEVVNPKKEEIGLILLALKDLYTGDIALGGEKSVGRGRVDGQLIQLNLDNNKIEIKKGKPVEERERAIINSYVESFTKGGN